MDLYHLSRVIIFLLILIKYSKGYVLNVEICLKLIYNLESDFEGSMEKYHYCQALAQTLNGVEQVIYKMQIKDHMVDAWLDLVKKRGTDYALNRLRIAKQRGFITDESSEIWKDVIKNVDINLEEKQLVPLLGIQDNRRFDDGDACNKEPEDNSNCWLVIVLIVGTLVYLLVGIIIVICYHLRSKRIDEECKSFLCEGCSPMSGAGYLKNCSCRE